MTEEEWLKPFKEFSDELILHIHFDTLAQAKDHYKLRADKYHLKMTMVLCENMIALSGLVLKAMKRQHRNRIRIANKVSRGKPVDSRFYYPSHYGYKQLSIILKKQKDFKRLAEIQTKMKKQGWGSGYGDQE